MQVGEIQICFRNFKRRNKILNSKFKLGDHVRISKYKNILAKGYTPNWWEEIFVISKIKNIVRWTYVINDLKKLLAVFMKKNCEKLVKKNLE